MQANPAVLSRRMVIVNEYKRLGSLRKAAKATGCHVDTVRRWVERAATSQDASMLCDRVRSGRPRKGLAEEAAIDLMRRCVQEGLGPKQITKRLRENLGIAASDETVRRHLKAHLGRPLRPRKKPCLTQAHKAARLRFARRWLRKSWDRVVVTDSKYFWLCPRSVGPKRWVLYHEMPPVQHAERNCFKLHVYAGVSRWGRTPMFATVGSTGLKADSKGVNSTVYKKLLEENLIPACRDLIASSPLGRHSSKMASFIFQQDNAKAHTSKQVQAWLKEQDFDVMEWPSKSPDLSWIENMWGYVANKLSQRKDLTPQNFEVAVRHEWEIIPNSVHSDMYHSINSRLRACIENEGGMTKY
jgi:transposase